MRTTTIDVKDIEEFLKLIKMERDLAAHLQTALEASKTQLKHMEAANTKARHLAVFKRKYKEWYRQLTPEIRKVIDKAGRFQ